MIILSYGMGVDSTALLLRWLEDPRTFPGRDLQEDLIVLTAQVGDEWPDTRILVEEHIYPRLAEEGIRTVQVARNGPREKDGVGILADDRAPQDCFTEGCYTLSMEYKTTGTLPQYATGCRRCTHKAKGVPLDTWIKGSGEPGYTHVVGYNAEETARARRGEGYTALGDLDRVVRYPLIEWDWDRQQCLDYIQAITGADWRKSACYFCPFAKEQGVLDRLRENPHITAWVLYLEYQAQALNPRSSLYKGWSLSDSVYFDGQQAAWDRFVNVLLSRDQTWAVYRVRRIYDRRSHRSVEIEYTGPYAQCVRRIKRCGPSDNSDFIRVFIRNKGAEVPWTEELLVALPLMVQNKELPGFARRWAIITGEE